MACGNMMYISRLCHDASPSVRLSVTEVNWRIANLGFKFRSHFTAHCGGRAASSMADRRASQCYILSCSCYATSASAYMVK